MANKYQNIGSQFLEEIWGKRARGLPLPKIDWTQPIRHENVLYLLSRYPFLQMISSDPQFNEEIQPKFIKAQSGWTIHDYGDAMSASPGELMYGNYSGKKPDDDDDEGGTGTIVNQAVITAQEMIAIAKKKGWPGVAIADGTELMKWAAWVAAENYNFDLMGYEPTEKDKEKRDRVLRILTEFTRTMEERLAITPTKTRRLRK